MTRTYTTSFPASFRLLLLAAVVVLGLAALMLAGVERAQACEGAEFEAYFPNGDYFEAGSEEFLNALGHFMQNHYGTEYGGSGGCGGFESAGGSLDPHVFILAGPPNPITQGDSSTVTWYSGNVTSCSVDQGIGSVTPGEWGSRLVSPPQTTTYTITCLQAATGTTVDASATLVVNPAPVQPPTATLVANPDTITEGESSTLSWTSSNATSCSINHGIGSVTPNIPGSDEVSPTETTTYQITCEGQNGQQASAYAVVTVTLVEPPCEGENCPCEGAECLPCEGENCPCEGSSCGNGPDGNPDLSCDVSPTSLPETGGSVTYTASGATGLFTWNNFVDPPFTTGETVIRNIPAGNASYGMTVSKDGYTSGNCPLVTVGTGASCGTASISNFSANPNRVRADNNDGTTLTYSASGVDSSCTISGPNILNTVVAPTPGACSVSGTLDTPPITQQSVYRINCDSGEDTAEAVVNLIPRFIEF